MRYTTTALFLVASLITLGADAAAQQTYQVVVNAQNTVAALTAAEVSRLFLKQTTRWDDGQAVVPVDQAEGARVRGQFTQAVHGRSVSAIKAHCQRQIFSGRGVPPVEKASDQEVLDYVRSNASAVGYVSAGARLGNGVKAVTVTGG